MRWGEVGEGRFVMCGEEGEGGGEGEWEEVRHIL